MISFVGNVQLPVRILSDICHVCWNFLPRVLISPTMLLVALSGVQAQSQHLFTRTLSYCVISSVSLNTQLSDDAVT